MKIYKSFSEAINQIESDMTLKSYVIETEKWQGIKLPQPMREMLNVSFQVVMGDISEHVIIKDIEPNLPWADIHFKERVGGSAMNPDPSHELWPFSQKKNDQHRKDERFTHTYSERFWPKEAGLNYLDNDNRINQGLNYELGDLDDLIQLLTNEPLTRQAYLPIWFPEDTGVVHGGRVPCTLGYHFIRRGGFFYIVYYIRSCDLIRHFRDDIYLAVKLADYILSLLQSISARWQGVKLGIYTMHITSLHCFQSDMYSLNKRVKKNEQNN